MKSTFFRIGAAALLSLLSCAGLWAQATAQISGGVKDQSGAVLPGVEIRVTQTETGITRDAVTNETGSYALTNLPIGPYRLEASLPGFRTYSQTGIVLLVNSSPAVNVVMEVGQISEQVEVQANAALVETRSAGVGVVMENSRILELPLNGRAMIELVALSGGATPAPIVAGSNGRDPFSKGNLSVAGGLNTGLNYTLDVAFHNNPYDNGYGSMPFPDALQEFKVETGATGIQTGVKSSGSVSLVTKSGTNDIHGDAFEFVRNGVFNARNSFAAARDTIKRNQFGGTVGGPILKNKLFFFGGYQGTTLRQAPAQTLAILPTPAVLAGDFTAFASAACNAGRAIALKGAFVNNRIDPKLMSPAALKLASAWPKTTDPCGRYTYGVSLVENDYMAIGRIDYQKSANNSVFGRYLIDSIDILPPYNVDKNVLNTLNPGNTGLSQAFTLGDTYLVSTNTVNALRLTANRIAGAKNPADYDSAGMGPGDIGINAFIWPGTWQHRPIGTISGALNTDTNTYANRSENSVGTTRAAIFSVNDDLSVLHGNHQFTVGGQGTIWYTNSYSSNYGSMTASFNGQQTGLGLGDFFTGQVNSLSMGTFSQQNKKSRYFGIYVGDTWKIRPRLTATYGVRWEPYFPVVNLDTAVFHFDADALAKGVGSTRFSTTPPGMKFIGDPGFPGKSGMNNKWWNFSPRLGLGWDVNGDGRTSVRASMGSFYDFPATIYMQGFGNGSPFTVRFIRPGVNFDNPWANERGGDPLPIQAGKNVGHDNAIWPDYALVLTADYDTPNMQVYQWNLGVQRQISTDWLVSATYLGNETAHMWTSQYINPAVFMGTSPCTLAGVQYSNCSTTANTNQRRVLSLANPSTGRYYGAIQKVDAGGTASYNGLLLSVQRRAKGVTLGGNYTWSHCIGDPGGLERASSGGTEAYSDPNNRRFDRGNCTLAATDRRQVLNLSAVATTPQFSNAAMRTVASSWTFSPIVRILSGSFLTVVSGQDRALTSSGNQRADQVLGNPFGTKTVSNYINPAAFALPALGTLGRSPMGNIRGPGNWQFDIAMSRLFKVRERQSVEVRAEAFNVTNSFRMNNPIVAFNSSVFGQVTSAYDPRIMQFALKYVF